MIDQARNIALLIARVVVGVIFLVHGYQKFAMGLGGTAAFFDSIGVPLPGVAAPLVATLEVAGGIALILGVALPVVGTLLALNMVGATLFAHLPAGFAVAEGGYEFVLALAAASLAIGFTGGGALALDTLLGRRRATASA